MLTQIIRTGLIFSIVILWGCSTSGQVETSEVLPSSVKNTQYYIGTGDSLNINVWRNEELTMTIPVRPDGKISMPLIGEVQAAGLTAGKLSEQLQTKLLNFIRNPQVTVIVVAADSSDYQSRVRVTGSVETPISLPYREGMTVLDLVLEAGGLTEFARGNGAKLFRKTDEGVKAYNIRVQDILNKGNLSTNYELAPSDIITIPERLF